MTLAELFAHTFGTRRAEPALDWQDRTFTFGEIDARAGRMARALAARGVRRGDRLAVWLPNRVEVIDLYLACARLGAIYVPINILYRERELDHILRDSSPRALVSAGPPPTTQPVDLWPLDALASVQDSPSGTALPPAPLDDSTPAALIYTSGTTGPAKGAVLTQGNFAANARRLIEAWRITAADRLLLSPPLFHVHGLGNGLHCWLASGLRLRLLERFDHTTAAAEFLDFAPTLFFGVPAMYVRMLDWPPDTAHAIGGRTRLFVSGSAPLSAATFGAFRARFGHAILERYGMTEALMITSNPYDGERRPGTVGLPLPGVSLRLVDAEGRAVADGVTGEIHVESESLCAGYWGQPAAWTAALVGASFRTGDLAVRSADGYYTLQGRRSELIISAGFNIYPREIEEWLVEQDSIVDAAVVGAPDPVRGEVPVAYVVLAAGASLDAAALEAACRRSLASFKVPRAFVAVERIPRTALGKVQKHLL